MSSHTTGVINHSLTPIPLNERVFSWNAQASLWFSLGVGLLVMQVGAYLVPGMGPRDAALAIVLGSLLGSALLAWTASLGCSSGLSSAGLMHRTYGSAFAHLPILLNIVQLIGWTTYELVVMGEGTVAIGAQALGLNAQGAGAREIATLFWGLVLMALLTGSMTSLVRRFVSRFGLPLVILSLIWLSWQFFQRVDAQGWQAFWNKAGDGSMGMFSAIDLVIAMPVSWLPLVADYSRYGRSAKGAFWGTWTGYALANAWCYGLGVLVISTAEPGSNLVTALLLAQGGLIALGLILIDELDNAYGDAHSGAVSAHSIQPRRSIRTWGLLITIVCIVFAIVLPMHSLEPFLLMLSSVFVPLYGVILGRLSLGGIGHAQDRKIDWSAASLWVLGVVCYHALAQFAPQWGSALPTLALTFTLAWLTRPSGVLSPRPA